MRLVIPTGIALGINPFFTGVLMFLFSIGTLLMITFFEERLRYMPFSTKAQRKIEEKSGRMYWVWKRYGVVGLGLLSPLLTGAPIGAAIGFTLGVSRKRLILWMIVGTGVWVILISLVSIIGLEGIKSLFLKPLN